MVKGIGSFRVVVAALILVSVLLCTCVAYCISIKGKLDIQEGRVEALCTSLGDQIDLAVKQAEQYEQKIEELVSERDAYKADAEYWEKRAAFSGEASGQTDRLGGLKEFASLEGLIQWLANDSISEHKWRWKVYDCDDFAIDLTMSALADGYWVGLGCSDTHMFNFTIIGNDVYRIEASSDIVEFWGEVD